MILLIATWRWEVPSKAESFFGQDFSVMVEQVKEKASETASKAISFFGMDFGTKPVQSPPIEPVKPIPEPSGGTLDSVFQRLLKQESGNKHLDAKGNLITSKVGAEGISQLMPKTAKAPGFGIAPAKDKSEEEYLRVGKEYLGKLYEKFGNWEKALAAYNAGMGNVQKAIGKAERFGGDWKEHLPKKEETLPYIKNILNQE